MSQPNPDTMLRFDVTSATSHTVVDSVDRLHWWLMSLDLTEREALVLSEVSIFAIHAGASTLLPSAERTMMETPLTCNYNLQPFPDDPPHPCGRPAVRRAVKFDKVMFYCPKCWHKAKRFIESKGSNWAYEDLTEIPAG